MAKISNEPKKGTVNDRKTISAINAAKIAPSVKDLTSFKISPTFHICSYIEYS